MRGITSHAPAQDGVLLCVPGWIYFMHAYKTPGSLAHNPPSTCPTTRTERGQLLIAQRHSQKFYACLQAWRRYDGASKLPLAHTANRSTADEASLVAHTYTIAHVHEAGDSLRRLPRNEAATQARLRPRQRIAARSTATTDRQRPTRAGSCRQHPATTNKWEV